MCTQYTSPSSHNCLVGIINTINLFFIAHTPSQTPFCTCRQIKKTAKKEFHPEKNSHSLFHTKKQGQKNNKNHSAHLAYQCLISNNNFSFYFLVPEKNSKELFFAKIAISRESGVMCANSMHFYPAMRAKKKINVEHTPKKKKTCQIIVAPDFILEESKQTMSSSSNTYFSPAFSLSPKTQRKNKLTRTRTTQFLFLLVCAKMLIFKAHIINKNQRQAKKYEYALS